MLFSHLAKRGRLCVAGSSSSYHESGFAKVQIDDWNVKVVDFYFEKQMQYLQLFSDF